MIRPAVIALHIYTSRICISCKTTGISEKAGNWFSFFYLVKHRTLHTSFDTDKSVICRNDDDITFFKRHIRLKFSIEKVIIDVDESKLLPSADDLDIP